MKEDLHVVRGTQCWRLPWLAERHPRTVRFASSAWVGHVVPSASGLRCTPPRMMWPLGANGDASFCGRGECISAFRKRLLSEEEEGGRNAVHEPAAPAVAHRHHRCRCKLRERTATAHLPAVVVATDGRTPCGGCLRVRLNLIPFPALAFFLCKFTLSGCKLPVRGFPLSASERALASFSSPPVLSHSAPVARRLERGGAARNPLTFERAR